jgi:hypothetical protein
MGKSEAGNKWRFLHAKDKLPARVRIVGWNERYNLST